MYSSGSLVDEEKKGFWSSNCVCWGRKLYEAIFSFPRKASVEPVFQALDHWEKTGRTGECETLIDDVPVP